MMDEWAFRESMCAKVEVEWMQVDKLDYFHRVSFDFEGLVPETHVEGLWDLLDS